jgi:hypothetical protein
MELNMKSPAYLLLALALTAPLSTTAAESAHAGHDAGATKIELNAGKKWHSDASLRKAMATMQQQLSTALPRAHAGKLTPAQYQALGADLTAQIAYIVQNCKLEPQADAQLHLLIAQLGQGIDAIEGKEGDAHRAAGVVKAAQALNTYGTHFEHAGWKGIKLPE